MRYLFRRLMSRIRNKIILPYLILAMLVTVLGAFVAFFIVAGSLQERLEQGLRQSALKTTEALVDFEDQQLEKLRVIAFNGPNVQEGLPATAASFEPASHDALKTILGNALRYYQMSQLIAFDLQGQAIVEQRSASLLPQLPELEGGSLKQLLGVQHILSQQRDIVDGKVSDKYSSVVIFKSPDGARVPMLYTAVPVLISGLSSGSGQDTLVGGLIALEPLAKVLELIEKRNDAFYTVLYDSQGQVLASNAGGGEADLALPAETLATLQSQAESERAVRDVPVNKRDFLFAYSPLRIRERIDGYFAVGVERGPVFSSWLPTRNLILGLTLAVLVAVFALGSWIARRITQPLQEVANTAAAIAQGQLDRRSSIQTSDEVGTLSSVLNQMTDRLLELYEASRALGSELAIDGILQSSDEAVKRIAPGSRVAAILPEEGEWTLFLPGEIGRPLLFVDHELLEQLPAFGALEQLEGLTSQAQLKDLPVRWVLPLRTQQRAIGLLLVLNVALEVEAEPLREPLIAIASMTATALQNALLYSEVEHTAGKNQAILQSIADGVIACDMEGRITLANATAIEMLKLPAERLYGMHFRQLPLTRIQSGAEFFTGQGRQQELYELNQHTVSLLNSPVISSDQRVLGEVVILHDMTAQQELDRARTDFIATISHELRTPLTPMLGYIDLLFQPSIGGALTANQETFLCTIRKHAHSMGELLNNVILIASIDARAMTPQPGVVSLTSVVEEALRPLRPEIEAKGLALVDSLPGELPALYVDAGQLRIALSKVLDNACRYTSHGSIRLEALVLGASIQLDVIDTGRGIEPEDLDRLFTRFMRGGEQSGLAGEERGAGLGLAIARRFIEQQGGEIWITSEPGKGTICSMKLPVASDDGTTQSKQLASLSAQK